MRYGSTAVEFPNKNKENPNKQRNTRHFLGLLNSRHVCVGLLRAAFAGSGAGPEGAGGIPPAPSPCPRAPLPQLRVAPRCVRARGAPRRATSAFPQRPPSPLRGLLPPPPLAGHAPHFCVGLYRRAIAGYVCELLLRRAVADGWVPVRSL